MIEDTHAKKEEQKPKAVQVCWMLCALRIYKASVMITEAKWFEPKSRTILLMGRRSSRQ